MQFLRFAELGGRVGRHHVAVTRLRPGQRTFEHTHDFVELFLVEEGVGVHCWNGRDLPLRRGALVFVRPEDVHSYRSGSRARLTFVNLAFPADWWRGFLGLMSPPADLESQIAGDPPGHVQLAPPETQSCAQALHDLMERGVAEPALLPSVVAQLTGRLLQPTTRWMAAPGVPDWLVQVLRDFADPELVAKPIAFWQKRAGVSPEHLARTCRRHLGAPPTVLLNRARVELVQTRLRQGEDKIAALALDAGFQNLGFFYRCFRRFAGCTPKEWQARHAAGVTVPR
jgi:AraC family transcriptional regulator, dual regulator of chb operon